MSLSTSTFFRFFSLGKQRSVLTWCGRDICHERGQSSCGYVGGDHGRDDECRDYPGRKGFCFQ